MNDAPGDARRLRISLPPPDKREPTAEREFALNLSEVGRILRRNLFIILICTFMGGTFATYWVLQITPIYVATSQLFLGKQSRADDALGDLFAGRDFDNSQIAGEISLMRSGRILLGVSETLNLEVLPEFNPALLPEAERATGIQQGLGNAFTAIKDAAKRLLGGSTDTGVVTAPDAPSDGTVDPITLAAGAQQAILGDQEDFVGKLSSGLRVRRQGNTSLLNIDFTSADPVVAAAVVNTVADQYISYQLDEKQGSTRRVTDGLNDRISDMRERLEASERAVIGFRSQMLGSEISGSERIEQQISELSTRLVNISATRAELKAELDQIDVLIAEKGILSAAGVLESELVRQLQRELSEMRLRQAQLGDRFGVDSQRLVYVAEEMAQMETSIQQEVTRLREEMQNKLAVAVAREASIRQQVRDLEVRYLTWSQEQIELTQLQREAEAGRLVYENFLTTFTQNNEVIGLQEADARVVFYAKPPVSPVAPRKKVGVALGLLAGLFAGLGLALLRTLLDKSIDSPEKLRRFLNNVPVVASLPTTRGFFRRSDPLEARFDRKSPALVESVRTMRNMLLVGQTAGCLKIAVISARPSEGKTMTSLLLAQAMAQTGKRTVVVETDLRKSSMVRMLGLSPHPNLVDVLSSDMKFSEILQKDKTTGAYILPAQPFSGDPAGLFLSARMRNLVQALEAEADVIIFDTPPLLAVSDALPILPFVDEIVLAVRWRQTSADTLRACLRRLKEVGVSPTCAVITMVRNHKLMEDNGRYESDEEAAKP